MIYAEIEQLAEEIYPDVHTPVDTGDSIIQVPDMVVSK